MADNFSEWDEDPDLNETLGAVNIKEGEMRIPATNNALREMMAQLKAGVRPSVTPIVELASNTSLSSTHLFKNNIMTADAFHTFTVGAASGFTEGDEFLLVNGSSTRAKKVVLTGVTEFRLEPTQWAKFALIDSTWRWEKPNDWRITEEQQPLQVYVNSTTGDDDDCDGLAADSPFETAQGAFNWMLRNLRFAIASTVEMRFADGTYGNMHMAGKLMGSEGGAHFKIYGNESDWSAVTFDNPTGNAIEVFLGCTVSVFNVRAQSTTEPGSCFLAAQGGRLHLRQVVVGECFNGAQLTATYPGSFIVVDGAIHIDGNANSLASASLGGGIFINSAINLDLDPPVDEPMEFLDDVTYAVSTAVASTGGVVTFPTQSDWIEYNGHTVTGHRIQLLPGSVIRAPENDPTLIPGSTAGSNYALPASLSGLLWTNGGANGYVPQAAFDPDYSPAFAGLTVTSTNSGSAQQPFVDIYRDSASPAVSDALGGVRFQGNSSTDVLTNYAAIRGAIVDPTNGSEDGRLEFFTTSAGANGVKMFLGAGLWMGGATNEDRGAGTINATALYDDGLQVTDLVLDFAMTGDFDRVAYAAHPIAGELQSWWLDPTQWAAYWHENHHLPGLTPWLDEADKPSLGEQQTRLTAVMETMAVHIDVLNQRIKALEALHAAP